MKKVMVYVLGLILLFIVGWGFLLSIPKGGLAALSATSCGMATLILAYFLAIEWGFIHDKDYSRGSRLRKLFTSSVFVLALSGTIMYSLVVVPQPFIILQSPSDVKIISKPCLILPTSSNIIYLPQDLTIKTNIFIRNVRFTAEIKLTLGADKDQVLVLFEKFDRSWEIWKSEIEKTVYRTFNEIASSCSTKEEFVLAIWRSSLPEELQQLGYFLSSLTVHE